MPTPEMQAVIDASGFKKGWKYIDGPETGVGTRSL